MADWCEYRKTAGVEAVQVTEENAWGLADLEDVEVRSRPEGVMGDREFLQIAVETEEGGITAPVHENPYLCRGIDGEFWLVQGHIFERTYEEVGR